MVLGRKLLVPAQFHNKCTRRSSGDPKASSSVRSLLEPELARLGMMIRRWLRLRHWKPTAESSCYSTPIFHVSAPSDSIRFTRFWVLKSLKRQQRQEQMISGLAIWLPFSEEA